MRLRTGDALRLLAHDFNNLVGVMNGYVELLALSRLDEVQRRHLDALRGAAEEVGKLSLDLSGWAPCVPVEKTSRRKRASGR